MYGQVGGENKTSTDEVGMLHKRKGLAWLFGGLLLLLIVALVFAGIGRLFYVPATMPYYGGWFFFPFGFLFFLFIIFLVGRLIFWPWGWGWRRGYWYHHDEAGEILRQRYARGELTKEQFDQMMRDLAQHR